MTGFLEAAAASELYYDRSFARGIDKKRWFGTKVYQN